MKNKVVKAAVVIILIIAITVADFIWVGMNLSTYALENMNSSTSNSNVKFTAYFKNAEGKEVSQTSYEMNNGEMKLYMEVAVENEGYFDGVITLENSNFKIKQKEPSEGISKIEGNVITLNRVRVGNTLEIEVGIEPVTEECYSADMLSKESVIKLTGNYKDSAEKNIRIQSEKKVTLSLLAPSNLETSLEGKVITNRIYKIGEEDKRIVQIELNSAVVENAYPVKNTIYEVELPESVEKVEVISKGTYATNGEADRKLEYSTENQTLKVEIQNTSEDGKISWKKEAKDNVIVTMILPASTTLNTEEYNAKVNVAFYGQEQKVLEKEIKYTLAEEKDGIIRTSIENNEEIHKGKIYSREEREYKTITNIEVNYENLLETASISETTVYRIEKESADIKSNVEYKTTTISKAEIEKILGTDGKLTIKDQNGNTVKEITKDSEVDENGKYVVTYTEGIKAITLEITKAVNTGIIRLNHTKVIKAEEFTREEIKLLNYLVEQVTLRYNAVEYKFENIKNLRETTSEVGLTVIPQTISAESQSEDMQIAITLKTDNEKYELFKDPTFVLTMPEGVRINSLSNATISATNEEFSISQLEVKGRNIILQISGEQAKYITSNINSQITFTANVTIEKLMANKIDTIKMRYSNKGTAYDLESEPINVIASNSKIVTHLKLENYNGFGAIVERYSDSKQEITKEIPLESSEEIEVPIKYTIINNYNQAMTVTGLIETIRTNKDGQTQDLGNHKNTQITIEAGNMQVIEDTIKIPAGLYYSETIDVQGMVNYTYSGTDYSLSNNIMLATEEKEGIRDISIIDNKIQLETFAQLGNGTGIKTNDEIYNEQIVEYIFEVTNLSNETIKGLKITNQQENGNIYDLEEVEVTNLMESTETKIEHRYAELNTNIKTFEIETLTPGETKEIKCRVVAKKSKQNDITSANISVSAEGINEQKIQKISNRVIDSNLKISTAKVLKEEVQMYAGDILSVATNVENLTDKTIDNINIKLNHADGLEFFSIKAMDKDGQTLDIIKDINSGNNERVECNITKLQPKQKVVIRFWFNINSLPLDVLSKDEVLYSSVNEIISNSVNVNVRQLATKLSVLQSVNIGEGQKVKDGEKVIITGEISNAGYIDTQVLIEDRLPDGLEANKVQLVRGNETIDYTAEQDKNYVNVVTDIKKGEKIKIIIEATVNTIKIVEEELKNVIQVVPLSTNGEKETSNEIIILVDSNIDTDTGMEQPEENPEDDIPKNEEPEIEEPDDKEPEGGKPDDGEPDDGKPDDEKPGDIDPDDKEPEDKKEKYTVSGYAWIDKNQNKIKDKEEVISDVLVKIIDLNNRNTFLKDKNGKEIEVRTGENGEYKIEGIPSGNYNVIFKYDTSLYEIKESAEIKNYIIESTKEKVAITSAIKLTSDKTVNLELFELTEFDLKIDKYISKVIVQSANGTKTSEYSNKQLVKEEIQRKYLPGTTVLVEYAIQISNVGELEGYATEIIDYLPKDMKFHSELNKEWHIGEDGNLYNTSLASTTINPGESKLVKLVLLKTMTKENTGVTLNTVEISETMNIKEYTDINPSDNQSKAELIINPATGAIITYIIAILNSVLIVLIGMYVIKSKVIGKENDNE